MTIYKKELNIICKIYSKSEGFKKFGHCYTGEIDLTFHKKHISDDPRKSFLIKGAMIGKYLIKKEMSQGEIKYLDSLKYLKENCGAKQNITKPSVLLCKQ